MRKTGTQPFETHRLLLRPFCPEDAPDMYANWASDPEVTRYLTWPAHAGVEITRQFVDWTVSQYGDGGFFSWVIVLKETNRAIGSIAVVRLEEAIDEAEIGYCLGRAFWGRGIMPEALRAVIDYLFDTVGVNRIMAGHDVRNPNSGRVMEKAGMRPEGVRRGGGRNNQGVCDIACYSILRGDRAPREARPAASALVRFARDEDLPRVNALRRQVNDLHVAGKPDVFKPGFTDELRDYLFEIRKDPQKKIVVAELEGEIAGFAILNHIVRPENPFMYERDFLDIDEFGVDESCRRRGIASSMISFIYDYAEKEGFRRLELNMWEFNRGALAFYEAAGLKTFRRYMEIFPGSRK